LSAPGAWARPSDIPPSVGWLVASAPGTVASALREAGQLDFMNPVDLDNYDAWYRARIEGAGRRRLFFAGLATLAQIWVGDECALLSRSMFLEHELEWDFPSSAWLSIAFRALGPELDRPAPRARWRASNMSPQSLRMWRTSLLGRMPGWQPPVRPVGPWRPIHVCLSDDAPRLSRAQVRTNTQGGVGFIDVELTIAHDDGAPARLSCEGRDASMLRQDAGVLRGRLRIEEAELWWPHTHGEPRLYLLQAHLGSMEINLGRIGFRTVELDDPKDGDFGIRVNGEPIFCRGAVWTSPDLVALPCAREAYEPLLRAMRDADLNMVRISGAMTYEAAPFFDLCDELGLLVWQDFMFSNFDYPSNPEFVDQVRLEAEQLLRRIQGAPCLAVLCGGSEMAQQAAMLGLPSSSWSNPLFDEVLPQIVAAERPDCLYVAQTPIGGALPFEPAAGVCHYYGVSAYKRPIDDARSAGVRFAAEGLGFANVSDAALIELAADAPKLEQPCWGERRAGDAGALWFFEDVRNHYMQELYGVDPAAERVRDAERYLDLSRAVNAELLEEVFARWRSCGSPTRGGLVWFLRDLAPCAGWGMFDSENRAKSVWRALRRGSRPVQVLISDEGLNGLRIHLLNERPQGIDADMVLFCLRDGRTPIMSCRRSLHLRPRSSQSFSAVELWGAFFDANYAYRFGPPSHDVVIAQLICGSRTLAQAFHFPLGRGCERHSLGLKAVLEEAETGWALALRTERFAQSVHIEDLAFDGEDDWFHLPPGETRRIRLVRRKKGSTAPDGHIRALNGMDRAHYGAS